MSVLFPDRLYAARPENPHEYISMAATTYRLNRNNRLVSKRYALKNPEKVTAKQAHASPAK